MGIKKKKNLSKLSQLDAFSFFKNSNDCKSNVSAQN